MEMETQENDSLVIADMKWVDLFSKFIIPLEDSTESLEQLALSIFRSNDTWTIGSEKLCPTLLKNVISSVRKQYNGNKYHSFAHACHVLLNCAKILEDVTTRLPSLTKVETFALLFAALIHDIGHLGVSNDWLIHENHNLALLYSDQSVAEMHSLACGFGILNNANHDICAGFTTEERRTFRAVVIDLVLSTNISDYERQRILRQKLDAVMMLKTEDGYADMSTSMNRLSLLNLIIRAADVGASMQDVETSRIWSKRFFLEQRDAVNAAGGPSIDNAEFCSQHGKFMERHAAVLALSLTSSGALSQSLSMHIMDSTHSNLAAWLEEGPMNVKSW